jgi:proline dehydrogenase
VKKQGKNGIWTTVSLIDEHGSFRGEAKFETREEAEKYLKDYKKKIKREQEVKVFEEQVEKKAKSSKKRD